MKARMVHSERLQHIKTDCNEKEQQLHTRSEEEVDSAAKRAYQEAVDYLIAHTNSIKLENRKLRKDLYQLLQETQV